jgi:hypothetical protein
MKAAADPTDSWFPLPMVMVRELPPALYVVALVLIALSSRKKDNTPTASSAPISRVQQMVGNRPGLRRGGMVKPMRKNELMAYVRALHAGGWLLNIEVKDGRLYWTWPTVTADPHEIHEALSGYGGHCMFPKAIAYDPRIPGVDKKVVAGIHYMRYIRKEGRDPLPWQQTLYQGTENLGGYIGLERHAVARSLLSLEYRGVLSVEMRPRALTRIRIMPITASYVCIRTNGNRPKYPLWMPIEDRIDVSEKLDRLSRYQETGSDEDFADPQYWMVDAVEGELFGPLLMDDELRDSYIEDTTGMKLVVYPEPEKVEEPEPEPEPVAEPEPTVVEPEPPSPMEILGREFDRRAQDLDETVPASYKKVEAAAREWMRFGTTLEDLLAMLDLFFVNEAPKLVERNHHFCGACKTPVGGHCRPKCRASFVQKFIDMAPDLERQLTEPVAEQPEPEKVEEPVAEPGPELELTPAEVLVEEFQRLAKATLPGMSSVAPRYMKREAHDWLSHQAPEEILAVMELFFAGPARDLPSHAPLERCFAAQYPDLLRQLVEQPTEERQTA